MPADWTIVIPVKGTASAKSRLGASAALAHAIALDTVEAALEAGRVIVVTSASSSADFAELGAVVVRDGGGGLNAAISQGIAAAGGGAVAVLLGDVPALVVSELAEALVAAERHPLAFVPDADGDGTVLITALHAADHVPAFGPGSRAAHGVAGYVELDVAVDSGLRRDVDTAAQLAALAPRVGARTRAALVVESGVMALPEAREGP
jgi:2-phospho-L-lactate guanylyltransferase